MKIKYLLWVIACAVIFFIVAKPATADIQTEEQKVIALGESLPHSIVVVSITSGNGVETINGHGTGFYISPHEILTDAHVVGDGSNLKVTDNNGRDCPSTVFYSDPNADLALIDTTCTGVPLTFASDVKVGQTVVMMGNPSDERFFMTKGIVSNFSKNKYVGFDAQAIAGSSGSPVVNLNNEVVGVAVLAYTGLTNKIALATNNEILNQFIAYVAYLKAKE